MNCKTNTSKAFTSASQGIENSRELLVSSRKFDNEKILAQSAKNELTSNYSRLTTKRTAFTMAEILLSLTIIGVVAAITLPSLTGNINERTWTTQRKALLSRMSQAIALMPSMNGYGVGATDTETINNAAETFITSGLSKVLKINNICSNDKLTDCGFASQIINTKASKINLPAQVSALNGGIVGDPNPQLNVKAAAFETANGESILTFYNPRCTAANVLIQGTDSSGSASGFVVKQHVCANFIYDLNGKKGPNTVGKDVGIMTVIYSSDSNVVMPMTPKSLEGSKQHAAASSDCQALDDGQYRMPNIEELLSIYYNINLYGGTGTEGPFASSRYIWSSTSVDSSKAYAFGHSRGIKYPVAKNTGSGIICVQR